MNENFWKSVTILYFILACKENSSINFIIKKKIQKVKKKIKIETEWSWRSVQNDEIYCKAIVIEYLKTLWRVTWGSKMYAICSNIILIKNTNYKNTAMYKNKLEDIQGVWFFGATHYFHSLYSATKKVEVILLKYINLKL